jgi:hypothetical protein
MVLNRQHAQIVAHDRALMKMISKHQNDQESYFGCLFAVYGVLNEIFTNSYTFVDWEHPEGDGKHPHGFIEPNAFNDELLAKAYSQGALFARKFAKTYPEEVLLQMLRDHSKGEQQ